MLRENIDRGVKAVVKIEEKWRAMCAIDTSAAYTETYFRETNDYDIDGGAVSRIRGLHPFSPFPYFYLTEAEAIYITDKSAAYAFISSESIP